MQSDIDDNNNNNKLHKSNTCPALYVGLYRPSTPHRALQVLHYAQQYIAFLHHTQDFANPALYEGLCRPSSICRAFKVLHHSRGGASPTLFAGL